MKIKNLFWSLLACAAFVACSDNEIIDEGGNGSDGKNVPAYVSLSFTAKTTGDSRGNTEEPVKPEDTEITNDGTVKESQVKSLAVLIGDEVCEYYADVATAFTFNQPMGTYTSKNPFKVTAGTKDIVVVVNPTEALVTEFGKGNAAARTAVESGTYEDTNSFEDAINGVTGDGEAFMMANRQRVSVNATEKNTVDNPAVAEVNVERCVAKFTFRTTDDNVYDVTVTTVKTVRESKNINGTTCYKAKDANDQTVWYSLKEGTETTDKVYNESDVELTKWNGSGLQPANTYLAPLTNINKVETTENQLTVTLEGYYLSNLQNKMYNVRHISTDGTSSSAFGLLNGTNYLFDPYFADKKADNLASNSYFFNPYTEVSRATEFVTMPASSEGSSSDKQDVGSFMSYCFENAAMSNMQKHGYSTSITFKGVAQFKVGGTPFEGYVYKNTYYATLEDCQAANPGVATEDFAQYENGVCYYTTQIKHLDNGLDHSMGNMEFAVVRNNIYSLAVTKLNNIGTAYVDSNDPKTDGNNDPNVDDETGEGNIQLNVKIIPWVVRYNNIEF